MQRRAGRSLASLTLLLGMVACSRPQQPFAIDRLYDHGGGDFSLIADSTWRPILDPSVDQHRFSIAPAERGARLLFFPGIASNSAAGRVLFEITWQSGAGPAKSIYRRELSGPGWAEDDIEIPGPGPGELVLRTSAPAGSKGALRHAGWGDPTLLSGSTPARPSVILVSLDTLRADRLGVYGRQQARTPALDAFTRGAVSYDRAYSPSTWTLPSHQSMLYGIQAGALPATKPNEGPAQGWTFEGFESLADAFRHAGYLTGAFTGGGFVGRAFGMGRGFDTYFGYTAMTGERGTCSSTRFDGAEVFGRAIRWLRKRTGAPFFLFVHTYEAHDRCPVLPVPRNLDRDFTAEERAAIIRYYDEVVARVDGLVDGLLRELDALGLADSTVIAITSDHGEGLWEHGFWNHGCGAAAYEELSRVPLSIRLPRSARRAERVDVPVSTVDLAPTLLALAGVAIPPSMQGAVLPGLGLPSEANRPVYVMCGDWLSVRKGDLKLMLSHPSGPVNWPFSKEELERVLPRPQQMLFNTRDDPAELVDLIGKRSTAEDELRQLAKSYGSIRRDRAQPHSTSNQAPRTDPATAERLRALGYTD